jgi:hypothetical protein
MYNNHNRTSSGFTKDLKKNSFSKNSKVVAGSKVSAKQYNL